MRNNQPNIPLRTCLMLYRAQIVAKCVILLHIYSVFFRRLNFSFALFTIDGKMYICPMDVYAIACLKLSNMSVGQNKHCVAEEYEISKKISPVQSECRNSVEAWNKRYVY